MTDKQKVAAELKKYNGGAGVISKSEIARFMNLKKATSRVDRLVADLKRYEGRVYLVTDVAEAYVQTVR